MWICPKCKESIEDEFDSCWKCAGQSQTNAPSKSEPFQRPQAFWGVISVLSPFGVLLAGLLALSTNHNGNDSWGLGGAIVFILVGGLSFIFGLISAFIGIVRCERLMILPWIGLVLNGIPVLLVMLGKIK